MAVIEAIATTYLEADAASVTFSSIPSSYEHLQLRMSVRGYYGGDYIQMEMQVGVGGVLQTGTDYSFHQMYGYNTTKAAAGGTTKDHIKLESAAASNPDAAQFGCAVVDILDYANTNKNTTIIHMGGSAASATPWVIFSSGLWDGGTGAIDTLKIEVYAGADFYRGTEATLYGLNSAN